MILHDFSAPSPRRVRIFCAEKGLAIPLRRVDLGKGEQFAPEYRSKNPRCTVPMLELEDGSCLWDTLAICEYLDALHPQPSMFGASPLDRASVVMWYQRIEQDGFQAVAEVMRNASPAFKDHAVPGALPAAQIPALIERGKLRVTRFYQDMDERLRESAHVAGDFFSLADIQLLCVLDFGAGWGRMPFDGYSTLTAWHRRISERPSSKA